MDEALRPDGGSTAEPDVKQMVRHFYESYGWKRTPDGLYNDTVAFVDNREVMQRYYTQARRRAGRAFERGGRYFLDAASGANPYLDYSPNHRWHVCVDFALAALREARGKLGNRGLYVAADIAFLPFQDSVFDGVLSAHTLYHMPEPDQERALLELYRVLRPGRSCVILYTRGAASFEERVVHVYRGIRRIIATAAGQARVNALLTQRCRRPAGRDEGTAPHKQQRPPLYFEALPPNWFRDRLRRTGTNPRIGVYRCISRRFSTTFIPDNRLGLLGLRVLGMMEDWFPGLLASLGSYVTITVDKRRGAAR